MMMRVIRKKNNPNIIKAYGYVEAGGLGDYDSTIFEEVQLDQLPESFEFYQEPPLLRGEDIKRFLVQQFQNQSLEERKALIAQFDLSLTFTENTFFVNSADFEKIISEFKNDAVPVVPSEKIDLLEQGLRVFASNFKFAE